MCHKHSCTGCLPPRVGSEYSATWPRWTEIIGFTKMGTLVFKEMEIIRKYFQHIFGVHNILFEL